MGVFALLEAANFHEHRNVHVANGSNPNDALAGREKSVGCLVGPGLGKVASGLSVLEVELVIIREEFELERRRHRSV
jgi:hypothetical protein